MKSENGLSAPAGPLYDRAVALLRRFFGYRAFRPGQWDVIEAVASGRDAVVLMPTGGGKSMCYQIPALLAPQGCAVVVSPLIALMNDQVQALQANGIPAAAVHSNNPESYNREVMEGVFAGKIKLLYISPERLLADMERWNPSMPVSLFAIDEAHCISQWGHDFRPVYTALAAIKRKYPRTPVVALTATADRLTRDDIVGRLGLSDPFCHLGSFDRPNLTLRAFPNPGSAKRVAYIAGMVKKYPRDSGLAYCLSRKAAESLDARLKAKGIRSCCYHAGLSPQEREEAHRAFLHGSVQVVCATVAFGMGVDKSNIRWVVHNNMPANIESYYQEIGRAGRDGLPAEATLFYSYGDVITLRGFVEESGRVAVNMEKLRRMEAYAQARVCRRRILLSYFSEEAVHDCGNCDICLSPPRRFDGSVLAQKALSAVMRTHGRIGIFTLVDILRGSLRQEIRREGYDLIPTFGVGADLSREEWLDYAGQMVQLGLFEIAYDRGNVLVPTPLGMRILRGEEHIDLSAYIPPEAAVREAPKAATNMAQDAHPLDEALLERLKQLRLELSRAEGRPPFMIFSDATLRDMAVRRPRTLDEFLEVSGVGEIKAKKYGAHFLGVLGSQM